MSDELRTGSAYDIPPQPVTLDAAGRRAALVWWQSGASPFPPLSCPVCGARLSAGADLLTCPTRWCVYQSREIPWGVLVAYQRSLPAADKD